MIFREIANRGRKFSAYGLFSAQPELFAGLLEDPSGSGRQLLVSRQGQSFSLAADADVSAVTDFFQQWRALAQADRYDSPAPRAIVYAAYEAGGLIESLPPAKTVLHGPLLWMLVPDFSLCFDDEQIYLAARDEQALQQLLPLFEGGQHASPASAAWSDAEPRATDGAAYMQAVARVKAYIAAGDLFQANIARFWSRSFDQAALLPLYDRLRRVNPAPFAAYLRVGVEADALTLLSASPERLFRTHADGCVDTRPIAGTRRRGEGEADASLTAELLLSEKERAEHIMLVDLERNDLGRVCLPGSVEVNEQMVIERYATVQHIVSNVRGRLADGMDMVDLFRAMFPGGTITGCPKVRCMEVIHELEQQARGPYTGGIGYLAWDGSSDMNILIRTFWHWQGALHWATGAGIVADSDPAHELVETEHKAAGLLRALVGSCV